MNRILVLPIAIAALCLSLSACDKPTVNVGTPPAAVPGPAGPAGATGAMGKTGEMGAPGEMGKQGESGDGTTVIVAPAEPAKD